MGTTGGNLKRYIRIGLSTTNMQKGGISVQKNKLTKK